MKIYLNNHGDLRNFQSFTKTIDFSDPNRLDITTHDKWITAHPAHLVLAAALAVKVGKENTAILGEIPETGRYLDRMGLYGLTSTKSPFRYDKKEPSGRFVPISIIHSQAEQSKFITDMIPLLHLSEENAQLIKYTVGELIRNVLEHSRSQDGAIVATQYYKKTNRISIGICDTGIGIWKSMQTFWHPKTDLAALHLALSPGISGTTRKDGGSSENAGAGLFFVKSIAKITRNYFVIYSGNAEWTLLKHDKRVKTMPRLYGDPTDDHHSETNAAQSFAGTLVAVDISLDETPEFKDLMKKIGEVYDKTVRERKKIRYKEPKVI